MRMPIVRDRLYLDLRGKILGGVYPEGSRLPVEPVWAQELGVSRNALRGALALLENEGWIIRIPRKGTFVASVEAGERILTLLLPCADYLQRAGNASSYFLQSLLSGAMAVAQKEQWRVVTLPVSRNNSPEAIDWSALEHLNCRSRVIVPGPWFAGLLPFLRERGCQTAWVNVGERMEVPEEWHVFLLDEEAAARMALAKLRGEGCRKVVLAGYDLIQPMSRAFDGEEHEMFFLRHRESAYDFARRLAANWPKGADGLLLDYGHYHELPPGGFGLPSGVKIAAMVLHPLAAEMPMMFYYRPSASIGSMAAQALIEGGEARYCEIPLPLYPAGKYDIHDREPIHLL